MSAVSPAALTLRQAVAHVFRSRPTLRQVVELEAYKTIIARVPSLLDHQPTLRCAKDIYVQFPMDEKGWMAVRPLLDVLMEAILRGGTLIFTAEHVFRTQVDGTLFCDVPREDGTFLRQVILNPAVLNAPLGALVKDAVERFRQAQIAYWNQAVEGYAQLGDVTRHQWLGQVLRTHLARAVDGEALTVGQRACLVDLLLGKTQGFAIFAVQASLHRRDDDPVDVLQPDLLIHAQDEIQQQWLWCSPAGFVRGFDDEDAFAQAFERMMGQRYTFETFGWTRYQLEGDVLMQQSGLVLEYLLDQVGSLQVQVFDSVPALEKNLHGLTDPAGLMLNLDLDSGAEVILELPEWIGRADSKGHLRAGRMLLELGANQASSNGRTSLEGIEGPRTYTLRCLRERMQVLHPGVTPYDPDDLLIVLEGGADPEARSTVTLTEWALYKQQALGRKEPVTVEHRLAATQLAAWVDVSGLRQLIDDVDIGGRYPGYVSTQLDDPARSSLRIQRFASEWRLQLLAVGLQAWSKCRLSESRWQALAEFCRSASDFKGNVDLAPLAFGVKHLRTRDEATYMFVIRFHEPAFVLLYCPYYEKDSLTCANDLDSLMATIRQSATLSSRILDWVSPAAKATYDNNGFVQPHLTQGLGTPLVEQPIDVPEPAKIVFTPWLADADLRMYQGLRTLLVQLADRATVSNSEARWASVGEYILNFSRLVSLVPGPIGEALSAIFSLEQLHTVLDDYQHGSTVLLPHRLLGLFTDLAWGLLVRRAAAFADTLVSESLVDIDGAPASPSERYRAALTPARGTVHGVDTLESREQQTLLIASGWGEGPSSRRKALAVYAAPVRLGPATLDPASQLHRVDGHVYAELDGVAYQVRRDAGELRVVAQDGRLGPALWHGHGWFIKRGFFGGSGRAGQPSRALEQTRTALRARVARHHTAAEEAQKSFQGLLGQLIAKDDAIDREHKRQALVRQNPGGRLTEQEIATRVEASEALIVGLQAEERALRHGAVQAKEKGLAEAGKQDELLSRLARLTPEEARSAVQARRDEWRCFNLTDALYVRDELHRLSDRQALYAKANALNGKLFSEIGEPLAAYRADLAGCVPLMKRMLVAMQLIDELVVEMPEAATFYHGDQVKTVRTFIDNHHFNIIDMRFEHLAALAELSLLPSPTSNLLRWHKVVDRLSGNRLRAAAANHAMVLTSNLPHVDRLEVLQEAWYHYSKAAHEALVQLNMGSPAIDATMLGEYLQHMELLKQSANHLLIQASQEFAGMNVPMRAAYAVSEGMHRAVRTTTGELLIATQQATEDGGEQLVVSDPVGGDVLHRFHCRQGVWVETLPEPQAQDPAWVPASEAAEHARNVLEQGGALQERVRDYLARDLDHRDLETLVDGQIEALQAARDSVRDDEALHGRLVEAVAQWKGNKVAWLTRLHSQTRKPGAAALAFLHERNLLNVAYVRRETSANHVAFDEYRIQVLVQPGGKQVSATWAGHFHLDSQDASAADFSVGHLKNWSE